MKEQTWWALKHEHIDTFTLDELDRPDLCSNKARAKSLVQYYKSEFGIVVIPVRVKLVVVEKKEK